MSEAPWAKIWWSWFVSRSHIGLSGVALALGGPLMLICRESAKRYSNAQGNAGSNRGGNQQGNQEGNEQSDLVWVVDKKGRPITAAQLAPIVRFSVEDVQAALDELVDVETLILSPEGVYGFPNFWRYQESASAARVRRHRKKVKRYSNASCNDCGNASCNGSCNDKRLEGRGKRKDPPQPPAGGPGLDVPPAKPANDQSGDERPPTTSAHDQEVLDAFRQAYSEAQAGTAPTLTRNLKLAAVEHCRNVASTHGVSLREAALAVGLAAKPGAKDWALQIARVDPIAERQRGSPPMNREAREQRYAELKAKLSTLESDELSARLSRNEQGRAKIVARMDAIRSEMRELKRSEG